MTNTLIRKLPAMLAAMALAFGLHHSAQAADFTVVMLPDTQNYVDYTHQKAAGFAFDASEMFIKQMQHIASKGVAKGGDVVFVAAVGDVWQHIQRDNDPEHSKRGVVPVAADMGFAALIKPAETLNIEIPKAVEGYRLLSQAGIPFGVAPGNHDYDAWWATPVAGKAADGAANTEIHIGGLDAFRTVFGKDSEFFKGKSWYVDSLDGGSNSAEIFSAGGYRFLHLTFEMQAGDKVLAWAQSVLSKYPGVPTIITTHDYLSVSGERKPLRGMDFSAADPGYNNNAEAIWSKFISKHDQIFMVLSGHQAGQARRVDNNDQGHAVYQMLADYQDRGQASLDAGQPPVRPGTPAPLGDGWYRELSFHLEGDRPYIEVKTYSTHYQHYSGEMPAYARWYKQKEHPQLSDAEFLQTDAFTLPLNDFRARYGAPKL